MLSIFLLLVFLIFLFLCAGNLLLRQTPENPFLAFWLGLFLVGLAGLAASLFLPLDTPALQLLPLALGLAGLPATLRRLRAAVREQSAAAIALFLLPAVLLFGAVSLALTREWQFFSFCCDTELYHANIVRWLREYGSPPGLGNLHSRLGQSSLWFTLAAQVEVGPLIGRSAFLLPGLWMGGGVLYFLHAACRSPHGVVRLYALGVLAFLAFFLRQFTPGLLYDRPALVVYLISCAEVLPLFLGSLEQQERVRRLTIFFALTTASFLVKPLSLTALFVALALLAHALWQRQISPRDGLKILLLPALSAVIWITRNVLLSGWPVFPIPLFPFPVDWAMPLADVDELSRAVQGWARLPGPDCLLSLERGFTFWFLPWLQRNLADATFLNTVIKPFLLGAVFWIVALRQTGFRNGTRLFLLWSLLNIACWFFIAPDYRFGMEFFCAWLALGAAFALSRLARSGQALRVVAVVACALLAVASVRTARKQVRHAPPASLTSLPAPLTPFPGLRQQEMHAGTDDAFILYLPPEHTDQCGNAPLPCTPYPKESLVLRRPGDLSGGFRFSPAPAARSPERSDEP